MERACCRSPSPPAKGRPWPESRITPPRATSRRLVKAGQKIAVCEQLEVPGKGKKLLRRDVVRVITPGTITDTAYLPSAANNFLLAVVPGTEADRRRARGVALLDVSTGDFWTGEDAGEEDGVLAAALLRRPAEILLPEPVRQSNPHLLARLEAVGAALTFCGPPVPSPRQAAEALRAQFGPASLDAFGLAGMTAGLQAASVALEYARSTQGTSSLAHLTRAAAASTGRRRGAGRDGRAHPGAAGERQRQCPLLAARGARRHRDPDGCPSVAPVATPAAASIRPPSKRVRMA